MSGDFGPLLPRAFFARDALDVAPDLIGRVLVHDDVALMITEAEAYRSPDDTANHCRFGRTERNAPMWGEAGRAYVYLIYGLHKMLNLVTGRVGDGEAVLIRACEPLAGVDVVRARRGGKDGPVLLTGPGKVAAALALDLSFNHHDVCAPGGLEARAGERATELLVGPRVGVDYAEPRDREAPWRFALAGSPWVSARATLKPRRQKPGARRP